ncbi:SIS domain-containing protein [Paenibacillus mucilaginosus]|uniref:Fructosamine deglycase n=3 Tax=Paenibacillus mucilaginosus TaxID=61624 RepID=H6NN98_9BACL|nr:SIS domain-containing protein [Paenibacillus mucilaginosus]AEI44228.1 FrlB [Paenibacillus mucilaginosus KNP414]AFC31774.1 FrlB [Paenibacillus mucilaginosus 3016]AFH64129.1 fructosamine deglycase [Paenibacillus mucilaginosus K02]MCG7216639.1 SIS domain-containing protein [Paenibacillus mucilaginosus]WDM25635.1 SIS domain-containing protein [Paenibacillus mucilaginosus]
MMQTNVVTKAETQVEHILEAFKERALDRVFFVACGGSSALMYPSKYFIDRESSSITAEVYSSNEFIHRSPGTLGPSSLVILCSHKGKTPETTQAAAFAKGKGALTVALMYVGEAPLSEESDFTVNYSWAPAGQLDPHPEIMNYAILYRLSMGLLYVKEGNTKYQKLLGSLEHLDTVFAKAKAQYAEAAKTYAAQYKDEKVIYTMASGANYGVAYSFAICILMEMQWIHSQAIHAGEFFHGPFEILDKDVPFVLLMGLDETRPLEERALTFLKQYGEKLLVLDAEHFDLTGIDEELRGYLAPLVLNFVLRVYAVELAEARKHPLETRRYMFKVPY